MPQPFADFVAAFQQAIAAGDQDFIRKVYQPWVDTSGVLPDELRENFPELVIGELSGMGTAPPKETETFDDFGIATWDADGGTTSMTFRQEADGWIMFNERSGFTAFAKVYTLWYEVMNGKVGIRLNGKRSPLISEPTNDCASATISPINASLEVGKNTVDLEHLEGEPRVKLRIGSAAEGDIADSAAGDVLEMDEVVTGKVSKQIDIK